MDINVSLMVYMEYLQFNGYLVHRSMVQAAIGAPCQERSAHYPTFVQILTLKVLVTTIDALRHFETG